MHSVTTHGGNYQLKRTCRRMIFWNTLGSFLVF